MKLSNTWFALILMASALLLSLGRNASAASPNPTPSPLKTGEKEQQQRESVTADTGAPNKIPASAATTINQIPTPFATPPSNGDADQDGKKPGSNRWLVIFTGVLAIVGIAQFCAMSRQASYMRNSNVLTRATLRAVQRQAKAAEHQVANLEKTLAATEKAADAANQGLEIGNRAYLYLSEVRITFREAQNVYDETTTYPYEIIYPIHNGGQTPALYKGAFARAQVLDVAPKDISENAIALDKPQDAVIPPHASQPINPIYPSYISK